MYVIRMTEKEAMNLKKTREGSMGGFGGKKIEERSVVIIIPKTNKMKNLKRYSNTIAR